MVVQCRILGNPLHISVPRYQSCPFPILSKIVAALPSAEEVKEELWLLLGNHQPP